MVAHPSTSRGLLLVAALILGVVAATLLAAAWATAAEQALEPFGRAEETCADTLGPGEVDSPKRQRCIEEAVRESPIHAAFPLLMSGVISGFAAIAVGIAALTVGRSAMRCCRQADKLGPAIDG